jgi:hypothetical protein
MRHFYIWVLMLAFTNFYAQSFPWARSADGTGIDEGIAVSTDASGNVFITGQFTSSVVTFGTFTLSNTAGSTVFLAKYNSSGTILWVRKSISTGLDYGNCVTTDAAGNAYVSGYFDSPVISFGSFTLTNGGNYDMFLVKYDPNGNVLWARKAGDSGNDYGYSAKTDNSGNCYLAGSFSSSSIVFGTFTLTNSGVCDSYLTKYDTNGNVLWARNPTGSGGDENWSVCPDAAGNVYVVGDFVSPTLAFGTFTLINTGVCPLYLAKYDGNGNVLWVQMAGGTSYDYCNWVTVDAGGGVIITGDYSSPTIVFGTNTLTNNGNNDAYIVKYNSGGSVLWARSIGNAGYNKGFSLSADANSIYGTGSFTGSISFGSSTVTCPSSAPDPVYIVTYDYSGNVKCASALDSGSDDQQGISADNMGNTYLTSDFIGTVTVGATTLIPTGIENIYVAKYVCGEITGVKEMHGSAPKISPNPSTKTFDLTFEKEMENAELILINSLGQQVLEQKITQKDTKISTDKLPKGVYTYVVLQNKKQVSSGKLIFE